VSLTRRVFVGLSVAWATLLPLATFIASRAELLGTRSGYAIAFTTYAIGSLVCHQRPERSFLLFTALMPVCARCLGIYAGGAAIAILCGLRIVGASRAAALFGSARKALFVSAIPVAITLAFEWTTGVPVSNWIRAASGLSLGGAVAWIVCTRDLRIATPNP
jgi:uncharacterized membrane protein